MSTAGALHMVHLLAVGQLSYVQYSQRHFLAAESSQSYNRQVVEDTSVAPLLKRTDGRKHSRQS